MNQPKLTAEKFVESPFNTAMRLYRTGDLVKWLPDGNIEILGRIDHQIKLRGFRIELTEIEYALELEAGVKQAVVMAHERKSGGKYLAAYVVLAHSDGSEAEQLEELKQKLRQKLPGYMVPLVIMRLEALPLIPNGKVDRKALLPPDLAELPTHDYVAPETEIERQLVEIWSEVLGIPNEKIGIHDNFFTLGGSSLMLVLLLEKINEKLNLEISLASLLRFQSIEALSNNTSSSGVTYRDTEFKTITSKINWIVKNFHHLCDKNNVPGAQIAIHYNGNKFTVEHEGCDKITKNTMFRIGCNEKVFTAEIVLALIQTGSLELGGAVIDYLPFLEGNDSFSGLTILHLLSHTHMIDYVRRDCGRESFLNAEEIIASECYSLTGFSHNNNSLSSYSSIGYIILGHVCEAVTGLNYTELFSKYIITPYNLDSRVVLEIDKISKLPSFNRYDETGSEAVRISDMNKLAPRNKLFNYAESMGIGATAEGLLDFIVSSVFRRNRLNQSNHLKLNEILMQYGSLESDMYASGCGLGWFKYRNQSWGHIGNGNGHHSWMQFNAAENLAVVIHTNVSTPGSLWLEIAELLFGKLKWDTEITNKELICYCGRYKNSHISVELLYKNGHPVLRFLSGFHPEVINTFSSLDEIDASRLIYRARSIIKDTLSFLTDRQGNEYLRIKYGLLVKY